ncbi:MAG: thioredoxin domain-containing protein [Cellulophaga sp.]
MTNSLVYLVQSLLTTNKIIFDKEELNFQIQSHPSYPSLHSITGVLDHFNIENIAAEVPVDLTTLKQLPNCYIAHIKTDQGNKLGLIKRNKSEYTLFLPSKEKEEISEEEFLNKFTGVIVGVDKQEKNQKSPNTNSLIKNITLSTIIVLSTLLLVINTPPLLTIIFLIMALIGVQLSITIIKQEQGIETVLGDAFCSNVGEKKDCNAVLTSNGAFIIGNYKLSDLCLLYFSGIALVVVSFIMGGIDLNLVHTLSILAIPITIYSLYYQYIIVKKWCMLCLGVIAVLWGQTVIAFLTTPNSKEISFISIILIGIAFSVVFMIWQFLKPLTIAIKNLKHENISLTKFKKNYTLFETLLNASETVSTEIRNKPEIVFGNPHSQLELLIITNPFCSHCKSVHLLLGEILERYSEKIKITIRFYVNPDNPDSDVLKISSRIIELYFKEGIKKCLLAMDDIYGDAKATDWMDKWEACSEPQKYVAVLKEEYTWCTQNNFNFTPEILLNGKVFPKEYNREDLLFFIEELAENCHVPKNIVIA